VPFSEKRNPQLNTPIVFYHYTPGSPYLSGTTGANFGSSLTGYNNANNFQLGSNHPGIEMTGIKKTKWSDGFFRYTLDAVWNNPSSTTSPVGTLVNPAT
jgi:hypothetical protein